VTRYHRRFTAAAGILLILLATAPAAAAEGPALPEEFSAADQYVESVPTSSGPKPARDGKTPRSGAGEKAAPAAPAPVPPAVSELDPTLKEVATSPGLGAPERGLTDASADDPSVPGATVSAIDDAEEGSLLWLLLALLVVTGAIAGTAGYRHRARKRADA
jgi:hypothetical protein